MPTVSQSAWTVYILRCIDKSLYTGITTDTERRLNEHNLCNKKGARYTRHKRPVVLVYTEGYDSRSEACKREAAIKRLTKAQKEALIAKGVTALLPAPTDRVHFS